MISRRVTDDLVHIGHNSCTLCFGKPSENFFATSNFASVKFYRPSCLWYMRILDCVEGFSEFFPLTFVDRHTSQNQVVGTPGMRATVAGFVYIKNVHKQKKGG